MSLNKFIDVAENPDLWNATMKIYDDSFPAWEKEDIKSISINIKNGRYKMIAYVYHDEVQGFYILDTNYKLKYTLFTFLAVKKNLRSKGVGTKLCLNAINYFHKHIQSQWLLIEAEDTQAKFYGKLGFKKILIEYLSPKFTSKESVKMHLMSIEKDKKLDNLSLINIIRNIFLFGYSLNEKDERIEEQLNRIPSNIQTVDW
jgi:predicted GNAT family N-acyltransferase